MWSFKKNIFSIENINEVVVVLEQGGISSTSQATFDSGCSLIIDSICYFDTAVNNEINSGDYVYNDSAGLNPIIGGNRHYRVGISPKSYVVTIDDFGLMAVNTICT